MKAPQKMPSFARALGVVGLFWWIVFYVYTFHEHRASNPNEHDSAWAFLNELLYPLQMIGVDLLIIFICMACTLRATIKTRHRQWLALAEDEHFGLHSSMGKIETSVIDPMIKKQPSQTKEDQLIGTLSAEFSELIVNFIDQTRRTEPAVANAMRSCLALLCEHQHFPASSQSNDVSILNSSVHPHDASDIKDTMDEREKNAFIDNHHGQCTLLEHSLRVAAFAILEREHFTYQGLQTDLSTLMTPNEGFHFDTNDPLPVLVALVHDIGKLQTFKLNPKFQVTQVKGHHGPVGALYLAQLDCIKKLSAIQRQVLFKAITHYHNPYHFPINHLNPLEHDYIVANMMLLIKADKRASLAERRGYLSKKDAAFFKQR